MENTGKYGSSRVQMFFEISDLKNFVIFTGKHLWRSLSFNKVTVFGFLSYVIYLLICLSAFEYVFVIVVTVVAVVILSDFYLRILEKVSMLKWEKAIYTK